MKALNRTSTTWTAELAYIVGLMVTDGNLSKDGRHLNFTSKDKQLALLFKKLLGLDNVITMKGRGGSTIKLYCFVQFGDVNFYQFLMSIGLMPNKSKLLREIAIPKKYYFDFLRGHFDGDGTFYSYWDPRWKSSFMYYLGFMSASEKHILWLAEQNNKALKVKGHISKSKASSVYQLRYAKREALILLRHLYYSKEIPCLERKRLKVDRALGIIGEHLF